MPPLVTQEVAAPLLLAHPKHPETSPQLSSPLSVSKGASSNEMVGAGSVGSGFSRLAAPASQLGSMSNSLVASPSPLTNGLVAFPPAPPPVSTARHPLQPLIQANPMRNPLISLFEWAGNLGLVAPRRVAENPQPTYEIATAMGRALIRVGSTRATIRGVDVMLGHLPQFVNGQPCVHRVDYQKTLHPLLWPIQPVWWSTNRLIVIDPGHGGKDAGSESIDRRYFEERVTLDWAHRLALVLQKHGYRVALTRTNDADMSLAERVLFAETLKADLFVSLHFNSAYPINHKRGLETFVLTPPGLASSVVRDGEDNLRLAFPNNGFDLENLNLAWRVHKSVIARSGAIDRGVQRARFMGVLRGQSRPAILIEGGYLSNPDDAKRIGDPSYRQRLAEGVAAGIAALDPVPVLEPTIGQSGEPPVDRGAN